MKSKICHLLYLRCFFRMIWRLSYTARNWPMFWKETRWSCMLFFFGSLWSFPVIENTVWWVTKDCVLPILYVLFSTFDFSARKNKGCRNCRYWKETGRKKKRNWQKHFWGNSYTSSSHLSFSAMCVYSFG